MSYNISTEKQFITSLGNRKIICFGIGNYYKKFIQCYPELEERIFALIDNDKNKQNNILIHSSEYLMKMQLEDYLILITSFHHIDIKKQLLEMGIEESLIFHYPFVDDINSLDNKSKLNNRMYKPAYNMVEQYSSDCNWLKEYKEKTIHEVNIVEQEEGAILPYLTLLITNRCTLNCVECNNLMPYCRNKDANFVALDDIEKNLGHLLKNVDLCIALNITGGEPLLHKNIKEIVSYILNEEKVKVLEIITNGTILPDEELCKILSSPKVIVKVSLYKGYTKKDELTRIFESYSINHLFLEDLYWTTTGGTDRRNKDKDRQLEEYLDCWAGMYCKSLYGNKLYTCARGAFLDELGADINTDTYLTIDADTDKNKIKEFYINVGSDVCDFCDHHNVIRERIEAGIQQRREY